VAVTVTVSPEKDEFPPAVAVPLVPSVPACPPHPTVTVYDPPGVTATQDPSQPPPPPPPPPPADPPGESPPPPAPQTDAYTRVTPGGAVNVYVPQDVYLAYVGLAAGTRRGRAG
jgi:hypothetical protein